MRIIPIITVALGAILNAAPALACSSSEACAESSLNEPLSPLRDELAAMPADLDLVIGVRGLSRLRTTGAGSLATAAFVDPMFDEVRDRWGALSEAIGLEPAAAFDAILGERVILAVRALPDGAGADWVLLTEVSSRTEWTLRKQLKVSPRTIVAGQTLYTVERGALELTFSRPSADRGGTARLALAPSGSPLFERTVRGARRAETTFAQSEVAAMLSDDPRAEALVIARAPGRKDAWITLAAHREGDDLAIALRATQSDDAPDAHDARAAQGWNERAAEIVGEGAIAAIFDAGGSTLSEAAALVGEFFPEGMLTPDDEETKGILAGREMAMLTPRGGEGGGMALLAAIELLDIDRGAAMGDKAVDAMLESFGLRPRGFEGVLPGAVRRVEDPGVSVAWVYRASETDDGDGPRPGWWLLTTDPGLLDGASERLESAFAHRGPGDAEAPRAVAFARPARLVEALERAGIAPPPIFAGLRSVRELRWKELGAQGGFTRAEIRVLLGDEPAPATR